MRTFVNTIEIPLKVANLEKKLSETRMSPVEVALVGAGPYGLSIAAHLRANEVPFKIFGPAMETWREHMPKGMLLKSDGFASDISDPASTFRLQTYCESTQLPYHDTRIPVSLETFVNYGLAFQKRFVPELDERMVVEISRVGSDFQLRLQDGDSVLARRVVLAIGISHFAFIPPNLRSLPENFVSHSSAHKDPAVFAGKSVTVIGAGASAVDLATLLHESGVKVSLLARRPALSFSTGPGPKPRSVWQRMRNPSSGLGPGWKSRFFTDAPSLFRYFPKTARVRMVREHLGPSTGWAMRERATDKFPIHLGTSDLRADVLNEKVHLTFLARDGKTSEIITDHVITATGYRADVGRLAFLSPEIQSSLKTLAGAPVLSSTFQSSVPGLYFTGIAAAVSFGPMMRFAYGAAYTARRISSHLAKASHGRNAIKSRHESDISAKKGLAQESGSYPQ
jgi:cation diffusion facilitator CzcD-associated flavoprotein CzcO